MKVNFPNLNHLYHTDCIIMINSNILTEYCKFAKNTKKKYFFAVSQTIFRNCPKIANLSLFCIWWWISKKYINLLNKYYEQKIRANKNFVLYEIKIWINTALWCPYRSSKDFHVSSAFESPVMQAKLVHQMCKIKLKLLQWNVNVPKFCGVCMGEVTKKIWFCIFLKKYSDQDSFIDSSNL